MFLSKEAVLSRLWKFIYGVNPDIYFLSGRRQIVIRQRQEKNEGFARKKGQKEKNKGISKKRGNGFFIFHLWFPRPSIDLRKKHLAPIFFEFNFEKRFFKEGAKWNEHGLRDVRSGETKRGWELQGRRKSFCLVKWKKVFLIFIMMIVKASGIQFFFLPSHRCNYWCCNHRIYFQNF